MSFAVLSGVLFLARGILMLGNSALYQKLWVRRGTYAVDTILLVSALTLVAWSAQYPFAQPWLTAKVVAVVLYIVAGAIALKRGKTKVVRAGAFVAALLVFAYILKLAVTKQVI